ncbi:MAG: coproporphyrinogen III oxidase [Rhizobiales bacterium]|nr:coproporphyrinogen III oxidase [Hyphomicrobiales bacterium]
MVEPVHRGTFTASRRSSEAGAPSPDDPGFGIYVHWPFCASKCPYCDFNSHVRRTPLEHDRFRSAYLAELSTLAGRSRARAVTSIFFGGGTPSLMEPATVAAVIDAVADRFGLASGAEITLEANPSSVEAGRFAGYRTAGVNRVSLGIQALVDADLARLGRLHTASEARAAMAVALTTFERVSFDLIYARPGQTPEAWARELTEALDMAAGHLSLYQLTIEPGTPFEALHAAGRLVVPDPESAAGLYELTGELTTAAGLEAYEVSNYARPGQESRHNLLYWRNGAYIGIGPGAHGRLERAGPAPHGRVATESERQPERWLTRVEEVGHGVTREAELTSSEMADEMLVMGLRLTEGISLARLAEISGLALAPAFLGNLERQGLVNWDRAAGRLAATPSGLLVLDSLLVELSRGLRPVPPPAPAV